MKQLLSRGTNGNPSYTVLHDELQPRNDRERGTSGASSGLLNAYLVGLMLIGSALAAYASLDGYSLRSPWAIAVLALTAAVSETQRVSLGRQTDASISLVPILFAAVLFGPAAAMIVAAISNIGAFERRSERPYMRWSVYTCSHAIAGAITGFAAASAAGFGATLLAKVAIGTAAGALAAELSEIAFATVTMKIRGKDIRTSIRMFTPLAFASVLLYAPLVGLLAAAYLRISPLTLPLFLVPALAAQRLFALYQDQRKLAKDLAAANTRLERANLSFATALVATLDARDRYTAGHSAAVAIYARDIARRLARPCLEKVRRRPGNGSNPRHVALKCRARARSSAG